MLAQKRTNRLETTCIVFMAAYILYIYIQLPWSSYFKIVVQIETVICIGLCDEEFFACVCVFECLVSCFRYHTTWSVFTYNYIKSSGKSFIVPVHCTCKYMYRKHLPYKGVVLIKHTHCSIAYTNQFGFFFQCLTFNISHVHIKLKPS